MIRNLYELKYRLTLLDDSFMETATYVVGSSDSNAIDKLQMWLKTQPLKFKDIDYLHIEKFWCDVII